MSNSSKHVVLTSQAVNQANLSVLASKAAYEFDKHGSGHQALYKQGFQLNRTFYNEGTGYHTSIFRNPSSGEYIVASAGTELKDWKGSADPRDIYADALLGRNQFYGKGKNDGIGVNKYLMSEIGQNKMKSVTFAGHSLGGALSQYGAYELLQSLGPNNKSAPKICLNTFNSLGGLAGLEKQKGPKLDLSRFSRITTNHMRIDNDPVSFLGKEHVGGPVTTIDGGKNIISAHSLSNFENGAISSSPAKPYVKEDFRLFPEPINSLVSCIVNGTLDFSTSLLDAIMDYGDNDGPMDKGSTVLKLVGGALAVLSPVFGPSSLAIGIGLSAVTDIYGRMAGHLGEEAVLDLLYSTIEWAREAVEGLIDKGADLFGEIAKGISNTFNSLVEQTHNEARWMTPIILDLDGDGIGTVSIEEGVQFDHNNDGIKEKTGWVGPKDGLLVLDRNSDGDITSGEELFGNNTTLISGEKASNGFTALKELDTNNDGVIDKHDEVWKDLRVWVDRNSDGIVDEGELLTMEEAKVASINTSYRSGHKTDSAGNIHGQMGSYTITDGAIHAATDVWFKVRQNNRETLSSADNEPVSETHLLSHRAEPANNMLAAINAKVEQLINAMAGFDAPSGSNIQLSPQPDETTTPVLASNWQAA